MTADETIKAIDEGLKAMKEQKYNPFLPSVVLRVDEYKAILAEIRKHKTISENLKVYNKGTKEALKIFEAELEKKDRIINKMAEQLTTDIHSKEWVINYYEREVEEEK